MPMGWLDAHGITVGLLVGVLGWCWRIDKQLTTLGTDVAWLKLCGCAHRCAQCQQQQDQGG